jgi:Immunity protein 8
MMRFVVKDYHSPDVYDLETYIPDILDSFSFLLEITVGAPDSDGVEDFGVVVCTPNWLIENNNSNNIILGRATIIVQKYDWRDFDILSRIGLNSTVQVRRGVKQPTN